MEDPVLKSWDWITVSGHEHRVEISELEIPRLLTEAVKTKLDNLSEGLDVLVRIIAAKLSQANSADSSSFSLVRLVASPFRSQSPLPLPAAKTNHRGDLNERCLIRSDVN